jgi:hypothetical protein
MIPRCCSVCWSLAILPVVLAAGCSGGGEEQVKVTGTATRNGKAVPDLAIHFMPEKGMRSFGLTRPDGTFTMVFSNGQEGVLVGTHKVWVQLRTAGAKDDPELQKRLAAQQSDPEIAEILRKYGSPDTTPITLEIKKSQEINLTLD